MNASTMLITQDTGRVSEPFEVPVGGQVQLLATGLQGDDRVLVEIVSITASGPLPSECCPGPVALPEVNIAQVLRCRNGARVILTAAHPTVQFDTPQGVPLRVRAEADELSLVEVELQAVQASGCDACQCVEPYCPSFPLSPRGYAFADGDARDPDASVAYQIGADVVYLYPSARIGAAVPVRAGATVLGYAANRSDCAERPAASSGTAGGVTALAVDANGQVTLTQTGGPTVVSNNPNPCTPVPNTP